MTLIPEQPARLAKGSRRLKCPDDSILWQEKQSWRNKNADQAHRAHFRPGDRTMLKGTNEQHIIILENGATTTMNRFYVTAIEVITRSPRKSTTVYEQRK